MFDEETIAYINDIYPEDSDREYDRYLETGEINTIADYSLEDWPYENRETRMPLVNGIPVVDYVINADDDIPF